MTIPTLTTFDPAHHFLYQFVDTLPHIPQRVSKSLYKYLSLEVLSVALLSQGEGESLKVELLFFLVFLLICSVIIKNTLTFLFIC